MTEQVAQLVPGKNDQQLANEYRSELLPLLEKIADIFNRARSNGLNPSFNIGPDNFGRSVVKEIGIVKPL